MLNKIFKILDKESSYLLSKEKKYRYQHLGTVDMGGQFEGQPYNDPKELITIWFANPNIPKINIYVDLEDEMIRIKNGKSLNKNLNLSEFLHAFPIIVDNKIDV